MILITASTCAFLRDEERCEDSLVAALAPGYPRANGGMGFAHMAGESVDLEPETPDRSVLLTEALN